MSREIDLLEELRDGIDTFVERWAKIQRNSVKSIQAVTNTIVQIEHLDGPLGNLEDFQNIRENTRGKLLVHLFDKLVPALETSIKEFTKLMSMFAALKQKVTTLQTFTESLRGSIHERPDLEDLVGFLDVILMSIREVLAMFESEFLVKITIFRDLEEGTIDIGVVSNYLTVWTAEPNIEHILMEKLLKDVDEHMEAVRDVFEGKTGVRLPDMYRKVSY